MMYMGQKNLAEVTFFHDFRHSNQTSEVSNCSNVLFIFFDFCAYRVLSKTEENTEKKILFKEYTKNKKSVVRYKKKP
jgi:hypothetical protein